MIIMKKDDLYIIEDYVRKLELNIVIIKDHLSVLELTDQQRELSERTISLIQEKIDLMKEAKSKDELKKVLRVKKLLKGE